MAESASGRRLWLAIAASGLAVGAISVAFHAAVDAALGLREQVTAWASGFGAPGAGLVIAICAGAVALALWLTERFAPEAAGSGIQAVEGVVRERLPLWPRAVAPVKFAAGVLGIGGGLVLGREGPTVQMGATTADAIAERFGLSPADRRVLLAIGAGAGLTGAFNASLAGTLFVLEELKVPLRPVVCIGTLLASAITDLCCRAAFGPRAELAVPGYLDPSAATLVPVLLLGALCGAGGAAFNAALLRSLDAAARLRARVPGWTLGLALGAAVGAVAWFVPALPGGGIGFAQRAVAGVVSAQAAAWLLALSLALTLASYALGAPGGIFAPLLVLGALTGTAFHGAWLGLRPDSGAPLPLLAVVGMAGLFTGVVRAPLTGIVLLIEMTGSYGLALPILIGSLAAYGVAERLGSVPIYDSLLEREVARQAQLPAPVQ
jgi:chloride channel protein, CIC family